MFGRLFAIAGAAQRVVLSAAARGQAPRLFHAAAPLADVRVGVAKIPQPLQEKFFSKERVGGIIIPAKQLEKQSEEIWKFLLELRKTDEDAAQLVEGIKDFRRGFLDAGAPHLVLIKNPMPKLNAEQVRRFLDKKDINPAEKLTKEEQVNRAKEQSLNLDFLQMIMCLCGLHIRASASYGV